MRCRDGQWEAGMQLDANRWRNDRGEAVMHRRLALKLFGGLALCPLCGATGFGEETHAGSHWSYEGAAGTGQVGQSRCGK